MYAFQEVDAICTMKLFVLLVILTICGSSKASILCATKKTDTRYTSVSQQINGVSSLTNKIYFQIPLDYDAEFTKCEKNHCFTLWQESTSNGSKISIVLQGCWQPSGEDKCGNTKCIAVEQPMKALNNTKFCCCSGDYCNLNITYNFQNKSVHSSPTIPTEYLGQSNSERWILIMIITLVSTIFILFIITMLVYKIYRHNIFLRVGKPRLYTDQFTESSVLKSGAYTVDHLKLSMIVGQGRYGSVWQANMGDQDVAVKIYPSHYGTYFQNERDTYCLPFMEHSSLLHYFGANERTSLDGSIEYLLVLSYAPGGTLTDFLRCHTIDWPSFCKMGLTIVKGLAHLHTDICKGDKVKPCIAHRDINSRNILIKADGTCCICDLGLSVQISGSKYYLNDVEQRVETKSMNDVGTLRYMAPEILEGAVNLRDCESSLKQIDIYAMGLVLWELVSRCSDIYLPETEIPPYAQPFEREIGVHPTFEQMQIHVSRNKVRPVLQGNVVDKQHVRLISETMEDCWDADAEARLTALCIEERLTELQSHQALYYINENFKVNSTNGFVSPTTNDIQTKAAKCDSVISVQFKNIETSAHNLVHLSPSNSADDQSSTCSNEKPIYKPSESLESINSTQLSSFNEQSTRSDSYHRDYPPSFTMVLSNTSIASTSKQSLNDELYPSTLEYQTLVNPESPLHEITIISAQNGDSSNENLNRKHATDSPRRRKFSGWSQIKNILSTKKAYSYSLCQIERDDSNSSLLSTKNNAKIVDTNVTICGGKYVNDVIEKPPCDNDANYSRNENERPSTLPLISLTSKKSKIVSRQESLDKFNEIFNIDSNLRNLKDPHMRIKTPGDLPPSVRKMRGRSQSTARFSLYDDRIMCNIFSEEDDCAGKNISNSVPFGMDFAECKSGKFNADVTCF